MKYYYRVYWVVKKVINWQLKSFFSQFNDLDLREEISDAILYQLVKNYGRIIPHLWRSQYESCNTTINKHIQTEMGDWHRRNLCFWRRIKNYGPQTISQTYWSTKGKRVKKNSLFYLLCLILFYLLNYISFSFSQSRLILSFFICTRLQNLVPL